MDTCALVAASDFNSQQFAKMQDAGAFDYVIAADAGYAHVRSVGATPNLAVGDFDSLGFMPADCPIEEFPAHKDMSDLEIALGRAAELGFKRIVVFGALGGRLDHTIANMQLLARFAEEGLETIVVGLDSVMGYVVGPGLLQLPSGHTGTVSVFSLCAESQGVTEEGLEYGLEDASLSNRTTLGLSNELIGKPASIAVRKGTLAVFYPLDCLD